MAEEAFVGRRDEIARFAALLDELKVGGHRRLGEWRPRRRKTSDRTESTKSRVVLVHGLGGSGKSRLLKHFREMADGNRRASSLQPGQAQTAWLDWEDEQRDQPSSYADAAGPNLVTVLDALQKAIISSLEQNSSASDAFADYRRGAARMPEYASRFADVLAQSKQPKSPFTSADTAALLKSAASAGLLGAGHPGGIVGIKPSELALSAQAAGHLSQAAMQAITGKRAGDISSEEYDLVTNPQLELTRRVAEALRTLARQKPLLICLDTGEVIGSEPWAWLRKVMTRTGQRVIWVIGARFETEAEAGIDSTIAKFVREIGDKHLLLMSPSRFDDVMIRDYLQSRINHRSFTDAEIDLIAKFTRGLPLAISFTAELLRGGQPVKDVCQEIDDGFPSTIVAQLARRYLTHAENYIIPRNDPQKKDISKILGLALAFSDLRNDPDLIAALWDEEDPLAEFQDLARRHDFVLPASRRIHDDVRDILRIDLLEPYRRARAREINQRALKLYETRLAKMHGKWPDLDAQLAHSEFSTTLLSMLWHSFWFENQAGLDLLVQILPVVAVADPLTADAAAAIADRFYSTFNIDQKRDLDLLTEMRPNPFFRRTKEWPSDSPNHVRKYRRRMPGHALRLFKEIKHYQYFGDQKDLEAAIMILKAYDHIEANDDKRATGTLQKAARQTTSPRLRWYIGAYAEEIADRLIWNNSSNNSLIAGTVGLDASQLAVDLTPDSGSAWHCYAAALREAGRHNDSIAAYGQGINVDPDDAVLYFNRGTAFQSLGQLPEALKDYDKSIALDPEDSESHDGRGVVLYEMGRFPEALADFGQSIALNPESPEGYIRQGRTLENLGRSADALTAFDRAIALDSEDSEPHVNRGIALYNLGRFTEALAAFDHAITLNSEDLDTYLGRGRTLESLDRPEDALEAYERAVTIKPDDPDAQIGWGIALYNLSRFAEARAAFDQAIALNPEDSDAYVRLGRTLESLGRSADALTAFDQAIALDAEDPEPYINRGIALYNLDRFADALTAFDQAIALDSEDFDSHLGRGLALAEIGDLDSSLASFDLASHLSPDGAGESDVWAGAILWNQRNTAHARERFGQVIGRVENCPPLRTAEFEAVAFCGIGDVAAAERRLLDALPLHALGDRRQVRKLYYLLSDPELPGIKRLQEIMDGGAP